MTRKKNWRKLLDLTTESINKPITVSQFYQQVIKNLEGNCSPPYKKVAPLSRYK